MHHRRRTAAAALAAAVVAVVLAGCAASSNPAPPGVSDQPVAGLIAVQGPMTGPQASTGIDMARGAQLAVNAINDTGGVVGVKLQLVTADDAADPARGAAVARQLVARHVFAVIGPFNSSVGLVSLPIYKAAGIPIVRLTSADSTAGFGITDQPMASQVAPVEALALRLLTPARRVAVVYDTSAYTAGIASALRSLLAQAGRPVVADVGVTSDQSDPTATMAKVAAARPDVVYIAAYGAQAGGLAVAAREEIPSARCFVDMAAQGPDFVAAATVPVAQTCLSSGVPPTDQLTGAAGYIAQYQDAYHQAPGTWGAFTFDAVGLIADAVHAAEGWTQPAVVGALGLTAGTAGITGAMNIQPVTGNRTNAPVVILDVSAAGTYTIDRLWARDVGFPVPAGG